MRGGPDAMLMHRRPDRTRPAPKVKKCTCALARGNGPALMDIRSSIETLAESDT
jgi:hypothetical protein